MADTPKIQLEKLSKSFGAKAVLNGVDLSVGAGQSLVVIGGSGTGKSVMLKCILGILEPTGGTIRIDGRSTTHTHGSARTDLLTRFGMLFQGGALFDSLPVWRNVAFRPLQEGTLNRSAARDLAVDKLASVGLRPDVADLMPVELSGGMQKRVALARAIATDPEIVFFDEPTTGLDPIMADVINDLIIDVTKQLGATTLSITHDMASARKIADRIAMIHEGRIVWEGPANAVDDSGNDFVDQFVNGRADGPIKMPVQRA